MKAMLIGVTAVAATLLAPAAHAAPASIDDYLAEVMHETGLPGLSVVVTQGDRLVHAAGYGEDSKGAPVTADTPMRIASVSKSFTAMAVMTLVEDGRIALDDPVADQLPGFTMADPRFTDVTVRHLLNQTSGFSDTTIDVTELESATSPADHTAKLSSGSLAADPGTRYEYCNVNYDLAARLVEVASGRTFDEYLEEHVFGPLGMSRSTVSSDDVRPADGYNSVFGAWVSRPELPGFHSGGGGVVTTAADMGKWLISQTGNGTQLVSPDSLRTTHTSSTVDEYAMGWIPDEGPDGVERLVHPGNLFTYSAVQAVVPATGHGFAVLANSASLYDETYDILNGLIALSQGRPGTRRRRSPVVRTGPRLDHGGRRRPRGARSVAVDPVGTTSCGLSDVAGGGALRAAAPAGGTAGGLPGHDLDPDQRAHGHVGAAHLLPRAVDDHRGRGGPGRRGDGDRPPAPAAPPPCVGPLRMTLDRVRTMRNGAVLVALAVAALANGMATDELPVWRQLLYPVPAVLVYLHARHRPVRRDGLLVGVVAAVGLVIAAVRVWEGVGALASLGLFVVLPWLAGRFRRQQAELIDVGRERILQLERTQELVAERARLRERARIAADMHDSLGHELTLIALRAGALELTADTESTRQAAADLRESAVTATDRLRRTVGVLRQGATTYDPPDETVEALVERAARAGLPVALTRTGDTAPLPSLVDRAVHRVVQESLTNAARHAPGAPVTAEITTTADVLITVANPVDRTRSGDGDGSGSGLAGLAERVRLLGGTLRSGVVDGRFTVTARLPLEGEA